MEWAEIGKLTLAELLIHENPEVRKVAQELLRLLLEKKE